MRVALCPAGGENLASSRLRVWSLLRVFREWKMDVTIGPRRDVDVLFVQKRISPSLLQMARLVQASGGGVIYDADDTGDVLWKFASPRLVGQMLGLADCVTTNTAPNRRWFMTTYRPRRVEIVPDPVDYYPEAPAPAVESGDGPVRIVWFGNRSTVGMLERYLPALKAVPDCEVVVVTREPETTRLRKQWGVTTVEWKRSTFVSTLRSCHVSCLMHDGGRWERGKSNNKMIASIAWGVPAVVSRTAEYERTAEEAGVGDSCFSNENELIGAVQRLRSVESRREYLARAQPVVWRQYAASAVAERMRALMMSVAAQQRAAGWSGWLGSSRRLRRILEWLGSGVCLWLRRHVVCRQTVHGIREACLSPAGRVRAWLKRLLSRRPPTSRPRAPSGNGGAPGHVPDAEAVSDVLHKHGAKSVFQVNCGDGELLKHLQDEFRVCGCDYREDLLAKSALPEQTHRFDVGRDMPKQLRAVCDRSDMVIAVAALGSLSGSPSRLIHAMNTMMVMGRKKVIVWDSPDVCRRLRAICDSALVEYVEI